MEKVKKIEDFQERWKKSEKLVVKFGAKWCGPCKMLDPMMERLSKEYEDIVFIDCDIDGKEMMTLSDMMNIRGVPTILFVRNGTIQRTSVGLLSEATIKRNLALLE